jgi:UDP-glucose 4-epimerase
MVGTALAEALTARGDEVVPVDRRPNVWNPEIDARTLRLDLLDAGAAAALPAADLVVHCAANARVYESVLTPSLALENAVTLFTVAEHCRKTGTPLLFTSSREVYGNQGRDRYREDDAGPARVESPYAATKLAGEHLLAAYGTTYGLPWAVVRLSNVYGRYDLGDRFVPLTVRRLLAGEPPVIYGRAKRLDFTYLDDCTAGLLAVIDGFDRVRGRALNLSAGRAHTLEEAARLLAELLGADSEPVFEEPRPGEVLSYEGDISRIEALVGFHPAFTLREGLRRTVDWYTDALAPGGPVPGGADGSPPARPGAGKGRQ